jgi:hypothetical protein
MFAHFYTHLLFVLGIVSVQEHLEGKRERKTIIPV